MNDPNERTLMRQCIDGICHCDFRLTATHCAEEQAFYIMYMSFIGLSIVVIVIGTGLFVDRYFRKGHRLFETASERGLLRPKPIDCLVFFITLFNTLRMVASILIVIDHDPTNVLARSFMFEFSWHFGYGACALYLLGIAQTLSESHKNLTRGWLPSPTVVDVIGISFMMGPVLLHNICSITAGALAYSNLKIAEVFTNLLYGFWFMHCVALSFTVLFAGVRLIRILNSHLSRFPPSGDRYKSIRLGIFKIQALMTIISLCLGGYAVFLLVYACIRDQVTQNSAGSVAMAVIWNFWAPVATLLGEIALLMDPKLGEQSNFGIKTSSGGRVTVSNQMQSMTLSTTLSQQQHNTSDGTGMVFPFSSPNAPTLSLGAFDPFKNDDSAQGGPLTKPMFATEVDHSGMISMNPTGIPMDDMTYFQRQPLHSELSATSPSESDCETIVNHQSSKSHLVQ